MRRHLKWLIPVIVVVIVAVVFGVSRRGGDPGQEGANSRSEAPTDGRRAAAEIDDISVILTEVGEIQPKTMVLVKSMVSGEIKTLEAREGQTVRRGQVLATVEPDMAQARTVANLIMEYGRAKVGAEQARLDYELDAELHNGGHISDEELRLSKDKYDIANIDYRTAYEQMRLAEEDGVTMDLEADTAKLLEVVAPAAGTIIDVQIEAGEVVTSGAVSYTSGTTLMAIADLNEMQIKAGVNEVDVGKLDMGQTVEIDVDAYPNVMYEGLITHIAPAARDEQGVKIFDVEIDVVNTDERLRPGMTANITIQGDHREGILTIPIEAAFKKQGRYVVYVFDGSEDEPVEREVETGISNISTLEIISGLEEGETVALFDPELEGQELSEDEERRQRMARRG